MQLATVKHKTTNMTILLHSFIFVVKQLLLVWVFATGMGSNILNARLTVDEPHRGGSSCGPLLAAIPYFTILYGTLPYSAIEAIWLKTIYSISESKILGISNEVNGDIDETKAH
jgi:hypothetical protein